MAMLKLAMVSFALCVQALAPPVRAQELKLSGFASLVAGRTSGGCVPIVGLAPRYNDSCTRYIADWGHGAVYTQDWDLDRETRAGLQAEWKLNKQFSAVAQVSARTLSEQHANLEWAYLSWSPTPEWKLQIGRKRIPLYYYSDFQDVGYAYNTVRPTPDVYGWDIVNYNGASVSTTRSLADWTLRAEAYAGGETSRKNPYSKIFSDDPVDIRWGGLRGLSVELSRDWFTGRLSYTRSDFRLRDRASGDYQALFNGTDRASQSFLGLALNGDWDEWQWRSEFGRAKRMDAAGYDASFYLMTLSRQFGGFTVVGGSSAYSESSRFDLDTYVPVKLRTLTLAARYELHKGGALKLQLDRVRDRGSSPLAGHARVISLAYDLVF